MVTEIKEALDAFVSLGPRYSAARDYYEGRHRLDFASEKFRTAFGHMFRAFADNLCPAVCETVKDRLKLDGFTVTGGGNAQAKADKIWRRNRLKVRANAVHLDALVEGDAYVIVWPDGEGIPVFYPNRGSAVVIRYDDEQPGYIVRAAKAWPLADKKYRLNLYFPDRIEKYVTREKTQGGLPDKEESFIPFQAIGEAWPLPNPYGKVPVFHFGNRACIGSLGVSELREVSPLQDALNKTVADMLVASEFYGIPQRYAIGLEDLDEAEAKKKYPLLAGGVWATESKDAKFGEFAAADIAKFIQVSEGFRKEIARVSRTPLHYFALEGSFPSGEALKTAEAPLIAKVEDRQGTFGAVWSDAMRFALQIVNEGDHEPEAKWIDTTPRDETQQLQNIVTKVNDLKIPVAQGQREAGYTEKQIEKFAVIKAAEPPPPEGEQGKASGEAEKVM